ncbi:MAG TPA: sigma 54-interacting transcriptional regulator [Metabacillus sp.]|nr:sigma 54-interacting transcriptional regulator [Metabacillus sp.]
MYMDRIVARENFLTSRQVSPDIPTFIADSWKRSLSHNVDLNLRKSPKLHKHTETQALQTSSLLYQAFQTFMPKIKSISSSKYSFILADNKARLLSVYAKEGLMELLKTFNAVPGGVWSEDLCGTTAFGTTLVVGQSVVIQDAQHFCESWQTISCAGVPIFHPVSRKMIGVLDLTCFTEDFPANAVILTEMLAKGLETEMYSQLQLRKNIIENAYSEKSLGITDDTLFAIDLDGHIIRSNMQDVNYKHMWSNQFDWQQFFQTSQESILHLSSSFLSQEHPLPFSSESNGGCLHFIYYRDQIIGTIIQISQQSEKRFTSKPLVSIGALSSNSDMTLKEEANKAGIIGESPQLIGLLKKIVKVASRDSTVLLIGESGTGKEVLSKFIHSKSLRKKKTFVAINCATFSHDLVTSELFGYAPGMFTGAVKEEKAGLFEEAQGGTLFLDEIAELPLPAQAMLLRVLQEKQVTRIGEYHPRSVDVRVVVATNQDIKQLTEQGKFRLDLYYRLSVVELKVPSLRERKDDIVLLAEHLLNQYSQDDRKGFQLMPETVNVLSTYYWPGNVREIKNAMEHAVVFAEDNRIYPDDLPDHIIREIDVEKNLKLLHIHP